MKGNISRVNVLDLFSGIGGFSLGLERAGMSTVAFCEIEKFPRAVLAKHWPGVPIYDDVRTLTADRLDRDGVPRIDLVCGGYPCQPFSHAGKRGGTSDPRHLWPEMRRVVGEVRPAWVTAENVTGHITMGLDQVLADLEADGYAGRLLFRLLPSTPRISDSGSGSWLATANQICPSMPNTFGSLAAEVTRPEFFPTPTTQDASNNGGPSQHKRNSLPLNAVAGGPLNPAWVEWLMGFPEGWTDLGDSATRSSHKSSKK